MRKRFWGIVFAMVLAIGLSGPASAAFFEGNTLVVSIYNAVDNEVGVDTGINLSTFNFATANNVTAPGGGFSLDNFGNKDWNTLSAGIWGKNAAVAATAEYFATNFTYAPSVNIGAFGTFEGSASSVNGYYGTTLGTNPAVGQPGNAASYYKLMDLSSVPGYYNNLNQGYGDDGLQGEANLGDLVDPGYVDMYLYKVSKSGRSAAIELGDGHDYQAVIRLTKDGDVIVNPSAVPIPGALLLLGSGMTAFLGLRRKLQS